MNPGDWENCVPENIKAFEVVHNKGTGEDVTGSYGLLDMTNTDTVRSYLVGASGRTGSSSGTINGSCFCVEFNPITNEQYGYENLAYENSQPSFNCILDMRNKTFIVRKIFDTLSHIEVYFNNTWKTVTEGETFTLTNTNPSSLVFKYVATSTRNAVCSSVICLEEVQ